MILNFYFFEYLYLIDRTAALEDFEELAREDTSLGAFVRTLNLEITDATDEVQRTKLERSREMGVSAFRSREMEIRGLDRG